MESKQLFYRNALIIGWIQLLQIVVVMFIVSILRAAVDNDFTGFVKDPGTLGTNVMIVVFTIYAALPFILKLFGHTFMRWLNFGLLIFFFLFFVAHQLTHMIVDQMPLNLYHLLDFAHHIIILIMAYIGFLWARCKED